MNKGGAYYLLLFLKYTINLICVEHLK